MLSAQVVENIARSSGIAGFHIFQAPANPFNRFSEVPALPVEICRKGLIQCGNRILTAPFRVFLQLRLAFGLERHHLHSGPRLFMEFYRRRAHKLDDS